MVGIRFGMLLLGAGAVAVYSAQGVWAPTELAFTRPASPAPEGMELRPVTSTIQLAVPVDMSRVSRRTQAALEQRLAQGVGADATDASCVKRPAVGDCAALKLDGAVSLSAPIEVAAHGGTVRIILPLKVEGAASAASTATVTYAFAARHNVGGGFEIARIEEAAGDGTAAGVRLARQLEARLRPVAHAAQEELRQVLASLPVATATQRAWTMLSQPTLLGQGTGSWFSALPEVVGTGELITKAGRTALVIPISARMTVGPIGSAAAAPRRPVLHGVVQSGNAGLVRMAVPVRLDALQQAADLEFVRPASFETHPDRFGPAVKVTVRRTKLYPSVRQLALELDIAATRFEGQTFNGKAHLIGRPVLDATQGIVTLSDITFPPAPPREASAAKAQAGAPRLATEPFSSRLAAIARIDVSREISDAVPRAMNLLHQRMEERLILSARIDRATPVSIETSRDGAWLVTEVGGELTLTYDGPLETVAIPVATVADSDRTTKTTTANGARPIATPDIFGAVVSAGVASSAAVAAVRAVTAPVKATAETAPANPASSVEARQPVSKKVLAIKAAHSGDAVGANKKSSAARSRPVASAKRDWVPFAAN